MHFTIDNFQHTGTQITFKMFYLIYKFKTLNKIQVYKAYLINLQLTRKYCN